MPWELKWGRKTFSLEQQKGGKACLKKKREKSTQEKGKSNGLCLSYWSFWHHTYFSLSLTIVTFNGQSYLFYPSVSAETRVA